jgi:hypothetical protein
MAKLYAAFYFIVMAYFIFLIYFGLGIRFIVG